MKNNAIILEILDITQIVSTFIGSLFSIVVAYLSFKYFRNRVRSTLFYLDDEKDAIKLTKFLFNNVDKIFSLELILTDSQLEEFEKDFRISIEDKPNLSGLDLSFDRNDEEHIFFDSRVSSRRLKGYFKVIHASGPRQGWFSIKLRYVQLENIYNNI
jgi:hypothetical protein